MSEHIPIERCEKCPHYNGHFCTLQDLDTCRYSRTKIERMEDEPNGDRRDVSIYLAVCVIVAIAFCVMMFFAGCTRQETTEPEHHWSAVELLKEYHGEEDSLTEFQELILAIAYTESKFRDDAVGSANDTGQLQITKPYVAEINRIYGTSYTLEDAFDIDKSLDMFYLMQAAKNPGNDIDKAIYFHNKSASYRQTVLQNLDMIKRMEATRAKLIER